MAHSDDPQSGPAVRVGQGEAPDPAALPLTFGTFIVSLASSAAFSLGESPHPDTGKVERVLPLAKQTIDLIAMLQEKTAGNLTDEEQKLVEAVLYDLRLRYVNATRA